MATLPFQRMSPTDDSVLTRIITLALSQPLFTLADALRQVGWGPEMSSKMAALLENFSRENLDILRVLPGHRYAASDRIGRKAPRQEPRRDSA